MCGEQGTTVSSPFNYARNRIYALPSGATRRAGTTAFLSSLFLKVGLKGARAAPEHAQADIRPPRAGPTEL